MTENMIENLEEIKSNLDAIIILKAIGYKNSNPNQSGEGIRDFCPIHSSANQRSLAINTETGKWKCHKCNEGGGDLISLYAKATHKEFKEAVEGLASLHGIEIKYTPATKTSFPKQEKDSRTPQQVIEESTPLTTPHPYLISKKVDLCNGLLSGKDKIGNDSIVVPFLSVDNKLKAIQFVHEGGKFFQGSCKGAFFNVDNKLPKDGDPVWLAEGLATALTIWMAYNKQIPVISFGSINNLVAAATALKNKYPNIKLIICLDVEDGNITNTVKKQLHKLKDAGLEFKYCRPFFKEMPAGQKLTDFNDLVSRCDLPLAEVRNQLENIIAIDDILLPSQKESAQSSPTKEVIPSEKPIPSIKDLLKEQEQRRKKYFGKELIGFPQKTIPELDSKLLGFRDLILLAAAPNTGKTAIFIQFAIDTLLNNDNICVVFVSLEMDALVIVNRLRCYLSQMPWHTLHFGRKSHNGPYYLDEDLENLKKSHKTLTLLNDRMLILDEKNSPKVTLKTILEHSENLKKKSNCEHVMFVIDYLQIWPTPTDISSKSEIEQDKWRIHQMKQLRDANNNDPVLVISEARKPNNASKGGQKWGGEMSDVMGSSRSAYRADTLLLFDVLSDDELLESYNEHVNTNRRIDKDNKKKIREAFEKNGYKAIRFIIKKVRDGGQKGSILLRFHFYENRFSPFTWEEEIKTWENYISQDKTIPKSKTFGKDITKI